MPPLTALRLLACLPLPLLAAGDAWESKVLLPEFHAEGAAVGDLDGDGHADLAYGPFWFPGPEFTLRHRFAAGDAFDGTKGYSDNFFSFVHDLDGDGRNDLLVFGFPGKEARFYRNPGSPAAASAWPMSVVADQVANESPHFVDLIPGGLPEIVCAREKAYGYYQAGQDPAQPWTWHAISPAGEAATPFGHGLGVGDLDGDGRSDVIEKAFWYQQPAAPGSGPWTKHSWSPLPYGGGGAQILVHDLDGDGDNDLVTSYQAHGWGLGWFEQHAPGKFAKHDLMGESSTQNPFGLAVSQLHALALADIDGDGRTDFVTGKRPLAHQGKDPGGLQSARLVWFRNTATTDGKGIEFVPHVVHDNSGVGVEVKVADLNADGKPDLVSANKKGLAIHLQTGSRSDVLERWQAPGGKPQEDYATGLAPAESAARMEAPEGFSVDLVAAEPDLVQPIAMTFDARGRLWVVEGLTYPQRAPEGQGQDRVRIFADRDGDGTFETRKVFAEKINLASGIAVGFGGVYVGAAPYLLFYPDRDGNDVPDGEPEILLDGWGYQDTHETLNAFTWGPDGWLYGCHGVFTHSLVGAPGTPEEARHKINAGVWRFHPVTRTFEVYAHGTSNPWGLDFDARGDFYVSACVIPHFYHLSQGGRYQRQAGQHFDPWTFDDLKTIADHAHYSGDIRAHAFWGANKEARPASPADTSALGGGHAHCGLVLYQADVFPPQYRGDAFFHNLHGHRIVRESIERDGSGHVARHRPDFVLARQHDFIGVGILLGPDGALYFSDWTDPQTCHHRDVEIWDRSNGRLFRVRHGAVRSPSLNLPDLPDADLVATLAHPNVFHSRQAQRLLQERAAAGTLNAAAVGMALHHVPQGETAHRLRVLWTRHVCGLTSEDFLHSYLADPEEELRGWAVTLLGERPAPLSPSVLATLESLAATEPSLFVRRHLASLLQRLPHDQRWKIAEGLIAHSLSTNDRNIPLLCWYGMEPLVPADPARALGLVARTPWPNLKDFLTRRAAVFPEGREALLTALATAQRPEEFAARADQFLASLANLPPVDPPAGWPTAKARGTALAADHPAVAASLARLGARFGDATFFPDWRALARDASRPDAARLEAVTLLDAGRDPELGSLARDLLDVPALRPAALAALRRFTGAETATALVPRLADFPLALRNEAVNLIAAKPDSALVLLRAVDAKTVPSSLVSPVLLDQFTRFGHAEIDALIARNWVRGGAGVDLAQLAAATESWKKKLSPQVLAKADASRGRQTFALTCGTCHQLFGEGVALGPDLTGSNRADLGYLLENVLAPSAVVGKDYLLHVFTLKDGSSLAGMLRSESPEFARLVLPGGTAVDVKLADVAKREELPQSLMPAALFEALPLDQVADLVKYLASPSQVPLPGAPAAVLPVPLADGAVRAEGEDLVASAQASAGTVRPQAMAGFGPGWSGDRQLWWTGAKPGDTLNLLVPVPAPPAASGKVHVTVVPTTAKDYARIRVTVPGGPTREADLYTERVLPGTPLEFPDVPLPKDGPLRLTVEITGAHPNALPRHLVGIDRVEVRPVGLGR